MDATNTRKPPAQAMTPHARHDDEDAVDARGHPTASADADAELAEPAIGLTESHMRPPAWTRVKTAARPRSSVRHIMRRIGTLASKLTRKKKKKKNDANGNPPVDPERCELPPASHQRTESFVPCQDESRTAGCPQSRAEMDALLMSAQVQVANRVYNLPAKAFADEIELLLHPVRTNVTPAKRGLDRHYRLDQLGVVGGHRLKTYSLIWPILVDGEETAGPELGVHAATFARLAAHRQQLPGASIPPSLPPQTDTANLTEPESPARSPDAAAVSISPLKKPAHPSSPIVAKPARLSETRVELLPTPTPGTEPSPTKSSPPPACHAETPTRRNIVATSPNLDISATRVASEQIPLSPTQSHSPFRASPVPVGHGVAASASSPSKTDAHTNLTPVPSHLNALRGSQTQIGRPSPTSTLAPDYTIAASPAHAEPVSSGKPLPSTPIGPCRLESPSVPTLTFAPVSRTLDFIKPRLDSVEPPSSTPHSPMPKPGDLDKGSDVFDFGPTSSSFNSPSPHLPKWASPRAPDKSQKKPRRKSEPLFRTFFKSRAPLRLTGSAKRVAAAKRVTFQDDSVSEDTPSLARKRPCQLEPCAESAGTLTPDLTISPAATFSTAMTPAISWARMTGRAAPDAAAQGTPQTMRQIHSRDSVLSVDMRRTVDIFGGEAPTPLDRGAEAVSRLAQIAQAHCDGQAKVVVSQEPGRLFVRFKLPIGFASLFPQNHARSSTTAMAASSSSIVSSCRHQPSMRDAASGSHISPIRTPAQSPLNPDDTMVCEGFAPSPWGFSKNAFTADYHGASTLSANATIAFGIADCSGTTDATDAMCLDKVSTAVEEDHDMDDAARAKSWTQPDLEMRDLPDSTDVPTARDAQVSPHHEQSLSCTQWTPVTAGHEDHECRDVHHLTRDDNYDSPGREYMRDFISRARPKRLSATECGSPIALPAKRPPLGAKDPNTASSLRQARIMEQGPWTRFKREEAPVLQPPSTEGSQDHVMEDGEPNPGQKTASLHSGDEEMADAPVKRRSTRLRTQRKPTAAPKSSIPTAIKVDSRSGCGRGQATKGKARSGQTDVCQQTRTNTRKNKGNAEYPADMLARLGSDEMEVDARASRAAKSSDTKRVGWREPLESHQEEERPRRGRGGVAKARATQGHSWVEKVTSPAAGEKKKRAAQVAAGLGLSGNGTPGRLGRVTRAAARAQK